MSECLGAEGSRVKLDRIDGPVRPGSVAETDVHIHGGNRPATVRRLILRIVEARRHWTDSSGTTVNDTEAQERSDRRELTPVWTRQILAESQVDVAATVEAGTPHTVPVSLEIPLQCGQTSAACVITMHAQADIPGQIDPTGTTAIPVA